MFLIDAQYCTFIINTDEILLGFTFAALQRVDPYRPEVSRFAQQCMGCFARPRSESVRGKRAEGISR